jgi:hypothetical protein
MAGAIMLREKFSGRLPVQFKHIAHLAARNTTGAVAFKSRAFEQSLGGNLRRVSKRTRRVIR